VADSALRSSDTKQAPLTTNEGMSFGLPICIVQTMDSPNESARYCDANFHTPNDCHHRRLSRSLFKLCERRQQKQELIPYHVLNNNVSKLMNRSLNEVTQCSTTATLISSVTNLLFPGRRLSSLRMLQTRSNRK